MAINRIRADIDLDAILYNMESMHNKLKPGTMMAAVVKADGYGHGAEAVSEILEPLPYLWGYAVATSNEAMELIAAGSCRVVDRAEFKLMSGYGTTIQGQA